MSNLALYIAALGVEVIDFDNDALEANFEQALTPYGELLTIALKLDAANETDTSVSDVAGGVLNLAKQFGVAFKQLTPDQVEKVKAAVAAIVVGQNEGLIESFFDAALRFITNGQTLNAEVNTALADAAGDEVDV